MGTVMLTGGLEKGPRASWVKNQAFIGLEKFLAGLTFRQGAKARK